MKCDVLPDERIAFAAGDPTSIDEHVATCDECQAFLAELWSGELQIDLSEPVLKIVRMEQFILDVARMSGDLLARMVEALMVYGAGGSNE